MANREYNYAVGRRKETTATVKLYGKGAWNYLLKTASGKEYTLADYFGGNQYLLQIATSPFSTLGVDVLKKFDAEIKVAGGGVAGQADAIRLAFARALVEWNSDLRVSLKPHGLLKRDPRVKERSLVWRKREKLQLGQRDNYFFIYKARNKRAFFRCARCWELFLSAQLNLYAKRYRLILNPRFLKMNTSK